MGWLTKRLGYGVYGTVDGDNPNNPPQVSQGNAGNEAWPVSLQGAIPITNAELVAIPASNTETLLLSGNIDTKTFSIFNNSTATLFVKFGQGVTTTFFNFKLPPHAFYEPNIYTFSGDIYGVWDTATGNALVSQLF